ncbi:MAG: class I SAM-dependent methyltransferase [Rubellimicrobium sp.]|nr:class I SAM-dependent methyltransferase [Rubellimicrobium sp.]
MWEALLAVFLRRLMREGRLIVTLPSGKVIEAGPGPDTARVTLRDPALPRRLVLSPDMALGEGYMNGTVEIGDDDLRGLFRVLASNMYRTDVLPLWQAPIGWVHDALRSLTMINPAGRSKANVAHHYDLSGRLYDLFLDPDKQYSCAYWAEGVTTLEQAQEAKKAHIARKLMLRPGMRVLDIGCGWGGMALTLARDHGARVVGVTLSEEQHRIAVERVRAAGLAGQIEIRLMDYRQVEGPFDRIVSVGMFEHVGVPQYQTYFDKVRDLLTGDGVALIHTIAQNGRPRASSGWVRKYIFPGGYTPALTESGRAIERSGLWLCDLEVLRLHYSRTLGVWHDRFMASLDRLPPELDARFQRMWRFYLLAMEMAFRDGRLVVHQYQLARRMDAVPITRAYLYDARAGG